MMIQGWIREDAAAAPERLRTKIPLTAFLTMEAFLLIDEWLAAPAYTVLRLGLRAAISLGFGCALRPVEYLYKTTPEASTLIAKAGLCGFKWADDDRIYSVLVPQAYPRTRGPPLIFVLLLDKIKNDPMGHGGPRAVHAPPPGTKFNLVQNIYDFLACCPPPSADAPLLAGLGTALSVNLVNNLLKRLAMKFGLDPARLLPHSVRVGSASQLADSTVEDRLLHGAWRSLDGMYTYMRPSFEVARRVTAALHDTSSSSIDSLRFVYMTPSVPGPSTHSLHAR
jgi:hypothetical protein